MSALSRCPKCDASDFRVTDSRPAVKDDDAIRRRNYRCAGCGHMVTTKEYIIAEMGRPATATEDKIITFLATLESAATDLFGEQMRRRASNVGIRLGRKVGSSK